ncbi:MAG: sulfite exporter TauE/SafE family protein [Oenococcus sp.]|uniref:sulfite exporter TauE/SafE family protein n=1 Tax=Oenococcus TaxID=46254 RepID=UPI0021E72377|nr:sulfite exporter TauE/SafE family protein [Oenococcus kitaharae]MCV3296922.1 sulfite exporter TauE/SafE family protein [Oenococcus kitaharae]
MISIEILLLVGLLAGVFGAVLGLGGGIIATPILTIMMGVPIKYAIGASIIAVIATSSGAAVSFLRDRMLNLRVAMFLEIATTIGAISGALLSGVVPKGFLFVLFGALLVFSAVNMIKKLRAKKETKDQVQADAISRKLRLDDTYYDKPSQRMIHYQVSHVPGGFAMMYGAGIASGLLGIGSGAFKVLAMDTIMGMPIKPSSATSNLMIGVTASASAMIYFFNGSIRPEIAGPLSIGILIGALIGSRIMLYLKARTIRMIFIPVLAYMGLQMMFRGF